MTVDLPLVLKTKYAFHALLWLGEPAVVLDIGSMDGSDSKRFRTLVHGAEIVAFEGNPYNYQAMLRDPQIARRRIRVESRLVSEADGERSFFVQRPAAAGNFNRGSSSMTRRDPAGVITEEVHLPTVSVESFLAREYPRASSVALWVDVEGHAHTVIEGLGRAADRVKLIHVEVETAEIWPGQKLEADVLRLASSLGFVAVAHGANSTQRDVILVSEGWYESDRARIDTLLRMASWHGPALSRILAWSNLGR
jgi:FkbM family methyltransferase